MSTTKKAIFKDFTNLYSVTKTLRFALKPVGDTLKNIKEKELLKKDEEVAEKYKQAKKIIDEYHKYFVHEKLSSFEFATNSLKEFQDNYIELQKDRNNSNLTEELEKKQLKLRKEVASHLKDDNLFKKGFIEQDLPKWLEEHQNNLQIEDASQAITIIKSFKGWTTYFKGFNENRKNMYTSQEHSTSVAYRIVHENLPKFINNISRFNKAKELGINFDTIVEPCPYNKELNIKSDKIFSLDYFNNCLTQKGIEQYNLIKGGNSNREGEKVQGINEVINLFVQKQQSKLANASDEDKNDFKKEIQEIRSCKLEELYKQILSDRTSFSFQLEDFKDDSDLCTTLKKIFFVEKGELFCVKENKDVGEETSENVNMTTVNITEDIKTSLKYLEDSKPEEIYINKNAITNISKQIFGDWAIINQALEYYFSNKPLKENKNKEKVKLNKKEADKRLDTSYFSFADTHEALEFYMNQQFETSDLEDKKSEDSQQGITKEIKENAVSKPLFTYFNSLASSKDDRSIDIFQNITKKYNAVKGTLDKYINGKGQKLKAQKEEVIKIKDYLDSLKDLLHFLKPLNVVVSAKEAKKSNYLQKDSNFYNSFEMIYQVVDQVRPLYDQARNYLTKKAFTTEKYKLNYENSRLATGWDKNKETDNTCLIFLKDHKYYLGIMSKKSNNLFADDDTKLEDIKGEGYQKMNYRQLAGAYRMLPKVFICKQNDKLFSPSKTILDIRNKASHTKDGKSQEGYAKGEFNVEDCRKMIDFFKDSLNKHEEWKKEFEFKFKDTKSYDTINEFYNDVDNQSYKLTFTSIKENYINQCVKEGKLFLFEIYSKDFSDKTKGKPNLQTLYWKELFSTDNLKDTIYKLNGEAELFYRPASITYSKDIWQKGHHANDPNKKQKYSIIKDKRYAKDTFLFHIPITANFKAKSISKFKDKVNENLQNNSAIKIIGIDRGERHLAYYTIINQKGQIIEQNSLNQIQQIKNSGEEVEEVSIDYHQKLDQAERGRDKARKSWGTIEKIKDLKEGYLSQVVHKLACLMMEHNAIIVFEDLNFGFKKGRFKFEKQIYQKLEKMLIDKLNYLVFKDKKDNELGGVRKALQLTEPFKTFKDLGKQTGLIFYVPAYHTSKVCPATGFVNLLYPRYETVSKSKGFFSKFDKISYTNKEDQDLFAFSFNYKNFTKKAEGSKEEWTIYSYSTRLESFRDSNSNWDTREIDLTERLKELFDDYKIDYTEGKDLKDKINKQTESDFFKKLIRLLRLILQLRNSKINSNEDWMISPVKDKDGNFFDSRKSNDLKPKNADSNGAYHVALKGLMMLQQLNESEDSSKFKPKLDNKLWYKFIQNK